MNRLTSTQTGLLLALSFLTFFVTSIQWYTQHVSYPISALVGPSEAVQYGSRYEAGLVVALYIPYFLLLIVNAVLLLRPPQFIPRWTLALALLLNLSIVVISLGLAVPLHQQVAEARIAAPNDAAQRTPLEAALLNINWLRVSAATISSAITLWMLGVALHGRDARGATAARVNRETVNG